jgi:hypothetical protein
VVEVVVEVVVVAASEECRNRACFYKNF